MLLDGPKQSYLLCTYWISCATFIIIIISWYVKLIWSCSRCPNSATCPWSSWRRRCRSPRDGHSGGKRPAGGRRWPGCQRDRPRGPRGPIFAIPLPEMMEQSMAADGVLLFHVHAAVPPPSAVREGNVFRTCRHIYTFTHKRARAQTYTHTHTHKHKHIISTAFFHLKMINDSWRGISLTWCRQFLVLFLKNKLGFELRSIIKRIIKLKDPVMIEGAEPCWVSQPTTSGKNRMADFREREI